MQAEHILEIFHESTRLPVSCFQGRTLIARGDRNRDFDLPKMIALSLPDKLPPAWYANSPEHIFFGGTAMPESGLWLLIGPVLINTCSITQAKMILRRIGHTEYDARALLNYFSEYTTSSVHMLKANLKLLFFMMNQDFVQTVENIDFEWKADLTPPLEPMIQIEEEGSNELENQVLSFVRQGNVTRLDAYLYEHVLRPEKEIKSLWGPEMDIPHIRNYLLGANMLASRTAVQGGLHYDLANAITEHYIERISRASSITDLTHVFIQMFHDYTNHVAQIKRHRYDSPRVQQIIHYIQAHLYEKITPARIAGYMQMNVSYLCTHFKRVTGKTIVSFVREMKIDEAKRLLDTKQLDQAEISSLLGFSSQSYFCSVFKNIAGMTPSEYQRRN